MSRKIYLCLIASFIALCSHSNSVAQTITNTTIYNMPDTVCSGFFVHITTTPFVANQHIETTWGDLTTSNDSVLNAGPDGNTEAHHTYLYPGTYTIKHVLMQNTTRIDSVSYSYNNPNCETVQFRTYFDANTNCAYDSLTESFLTVPITVQVDSANVPIDTLVINSGFYYRVTGNPGTVYKYTVISTSPGIQITCPANGILMDTVSAIVNAYVVKDFGFDCSAAAAFDLAENVTVNTGRHHASANLLITNNYCNSQNATLTLHFSPKYDYQGAVPTPTTVTGNTLTWNLTNLSVLTPINISAQFEVPGPWLTVGDTVQSSYYLTPTAGDTIPANNTIIRVDTVTAAWDPNAKDVVPQGNITAGTQLTYTIHFENTGNDTATNIYVLDTLSNTVLPNTLSIIASSATMNFTMINDVFGNHIAKFDFPNIMLPDSANNKMCTGMVVYSIKTKASLAFGTYIPNRAGIYFDDNEVVMTNTAVNRIGFPQSVTTMSNNTGVQLYPNPANDVLTIHTDGTAYHSIEIANVIGQVMIAQKVTQAETKVNVKALPPGIYTITLKGDKNTKVLKFEKL